MRAVAEGRLDASAGFGEALASCLGCRRCESVCPAGVEYGVMLEHTRDRLVHSSPPSRAARLARWVGFRKLLPSRRFLSLAAGGLGLAQRLGLVRLWSRAIGPGSLAHLPRVPKRSERRAMPAVTPAEGARHDTVQILTGCVMSELFGRVNRATARVLAAGGAQVHTPPDHVCCGALHAHNGDLEGARELARSTIEAFEAIEGPVVVNSAGCGAHMAQYDRLLEDDSAWAERAAAFASRVVDLSVYLAEPERLARLTAKLGLATGRQVLAWDDPCHLCHGQKVRAEPRALLAAIPGVELSSLEDPEGCCGSAGIHSLLRPAESAAVLERKLDDLERSGAHVLVTSNPGCHMQWATGIARRRLEVRVLHIAEVLARSLDAHSRGE